MWHGEWWSGATSGFDEENLPVPPSSQQVAEMANAKVKKDVKSQGRLASHQAVLQALSKACQAWTEPAKHDTRRPMTLMARSVSLHLPSSPDDWMLHEGKSIRRPFGGQDLVHFASVAAYLEKIKTCRKKSPVNELVTSGGTRVMAMHVGRPAAVPANSARTMFEQMTTRDVNVLQNLLMKSGILEKQVDEDGHLRFDRQQYHRQWTDMCLVWSKTGSDIVRCSCWLNSWRNHCLLAS